MGHLLIQRSGEAPRCVAIDDDILTVGRVGQSDIELDHPDAGGFRLILQRDASGGGLRMLDLSLTHAELGPRRWMGLGSGESINVGPYTIRYFDARSARATVERLLLQSACTAGTELEMEGPGTAYLRIVKGPGVNRVISMRGWVLNVRRSGTRLLSINRTSTRHVLERADAGVVRLNGALLTARTAPIYDGDLIELDETLFAFGVWDLLA